MFAIAAEHDQIGLLGPLDEDVVGNAGRGLARARDALLLGAFGETSARCLGARDEEGLDGVERRRRDRQPADAESADDTILHDRQSHDPRGESRRQRDPVTLGAGGHLRTIRRDQYRLDHALPPDPVTRAIGREAFPR